MKCSLISTVAGCLSDNGVPLRSVAIHYEYRTGTAGESILYKTRYTESDGITVITLGATESVSVGTCVAPYASEKISYTLAGVTYSGWKQFYQRDSNYIEVIRGLNGAIIPGAIEVVPVAPAPVVYNQLGFIDLPNVGDTTSLPNVHSFSVSIDGVATINGVTRTDTVFTAEASTVFATATTITVISGSVTGHYTY